MARGPGMEAIWQVAEAVIKAENCQLIDIVWGTAFKRRVLTLFVDKPGGINIDECQGVARRVGDLLDERNLVQGSYTLEVSSPGAERRLKTIKDFEYFKGRYARILTKQPIAPKVSEIFGHLGGVEADVILCQTDKGDIFCIPFDNVAKAQLAIKF